MSLPRIPVSALTGTPGTGLVTPLSRTAAEHDRLEFAVAINQSGKPVRDDELVVNLPNPGQDQRLAFRTMQVTAEDNLRSFRACLA